MKPNQLRWLNIAFLVVIVVSAGKIFASAFASSPINTAGLDRELHFDGVEWSRDRNIVLFLQTTCAYCHQSAPFHSELAELAKTNQLGIVAAFPESAAMAKVSLDRSGIDIPVVEADLKSLGVSGTPTLAIVDRRGVVQNAWVGLLNDARKREVLNALGLLPDIALPARKQQPGRAAPKMVSATGARDLLNQPSTLVVDIRPRERFRSSHLAGAINIPRDELEVRAAHELDKSRTLVVFCQYLPDCEKASAVAGLMTNCTIGAMYLQNAGFDVFLLQSDATTMAKHGYEMRRSS